MGSLGKRVIAKLRREAVLNIGCKTLGVKRPGGVVSFTFDDFPRSAWKTGGAILAQHGVRGTYYASLGFMAKPHSSVGPMFTASDVRELADAGHEFASHGHSHLDGARTKVSAVLDDVDRNAEAARELFDGQRFHNYAYPFGGTRPALKRALRERFATCRSVEPGLNVDRVDLARLCANAVEHANFDLDALRALLEDNRKRGGWLLFYTHDVQEQPSRFGCTPDELDAVVASAVHVGSEVLPVNSALGAVAWTRS